MAFQSLTLSFLSLLFCACFCAEQHLAIPRFVFEKSQQDAFQHPPWYRPIDGRSLSEYFSKFEVKNEQKYKLAQGMQVDYCLNDTSLIISELTNPTGANIDTFRYIDASTKIPNGILDGNLMWVGDYQECNAIDKIQNPQTNKTFKGKYFSAVIYQNNKPIGGQMPLLAGVCFPDSCNEINVTILLSIFLKSKTIEPVVGKLNLSVVGALTDTQEGLHGGSITTTVLTGILLVLVFLGSVIDLTSRETKDKTEQGHSTGNAHDQVNDRAGLLSGEVFSDSGSSQVHVQKDSCSRSEHLLIDLLCAFSVISNAKKLFGTDTANGPLACLNGIRVLSMWWVILGHTYAFVGAFLDNETEAYKIVQRFTFQPIVNGTFSVDSFFFLSGLLVAYLAIKEIKAKGMKPTFWVYFVFHRYWRLTPMYGYVILLYVYLMRNLISGPYAAFLPGFNAAIDECKSSWWANLLYINNLYPYYGNLGKTCLGWSWYLANDMQFYMFLSPVVILFLSKERRKLRWVGILITVYLILMCIVSRVIVVSYYGIYGLMGNPTKHAEEHLAKNGALYARPYTRYSVYLVGMLVGYVLAKHNLRIRLNKVFGLLGWLVCIPVALSVIYGQYYYSHHQGTHMTMIQSVFYVSLCRTLWAMCLAWVVLACITGRAWFVKDILSWKIWAPLGRLTYGAYLIHPILIYLVYFNQLKPIHFTDVNMVYLFLGNLVLSYALAFILSMMVEAPMIQLEKILIKHAPTSANIQLATDRFLSRFRR